MPACKPCTLHAALAGPDEDAEQAAALPPSAEPSLLPGRWAPGCADSTDGTNSNCTNPFVSRDTPLVKAAQVSTGAARVSKAAAQVSTGGSIAGCTLNAAAVSICPQPARLTSAPANLEQGGSVSGGSTLGFRTGGAQDVQNFR